MKLQEKEIHWLIIINIIILKDKMHVDIWVVE